MRVLRVGVVGVKGRGGLAFYAHRPAYGVQVVAAADADTTALAMFRETYGADVFTTNDFGDLLTRDLDALFITSPDFERESQVVAALDARISVFVESPMAQTVQGCDRILAAAQRSSAVLCVSDALRNAACISKIKELIDAGTIGQVRAIWCRHFISYGGDAYFKDWQAEQRRVGSLLLHAGVQDLDVLQWLSGSYAHRVQALGALSVYGSAGARRGSEEMPETRWEALNWPAARQAGLNPDLDVEDLAMLQMQLENGVLCSYEQCHFTPDAWRSYTVIGTEGRLENFGNEPGYSSIVVWKKRHNYYNPEGDLRIVINPADADTSAGGDQRVVDPAMVRRFVECLASRAVASSPLDDRYAVAAAVLGAESMRDGGGVRELPRVAPELERYFRGA